MSSLEVAAGASPGREARLQRALRGLAEAPPSADEAKRRPVRPGFAENLVFEFDEAYTAFVEGFETLPSEAQLLALQAVDTHVSKMVRAKDAELWTERARREDPPWIEVRALAAHVLRVFDWPGG
ncbi:MAG: hypothetical protein AAGC67_03010 [Myxococcota bacterium]